MKRIISLILCVIMLVAYIPSVSADTMSFASATGECVWDFVSYGSWGSLSNAAINTNGCSANDASNNFGSFKLLRGQNYYKSTSSGTAFKYRKTGSGNSYPKLADEKYFLGVYNPKNNYSNYHVDFGAKLEGNILELVKQGQIEMCVSATTINAKGDFNQETAVVGFDTLTGTSTVKSSYRTTKDHFDGTRNVSTGWKKIETDATHIIVSLESVRTGLGTQWKNRSAIYNVKVMIRDNTAPYAIESGFVNKESWDSVTNAAGSDFKIKTIGDTLEYYVKFNEEISVGGGKAPFLEIRSRGYRDSYIGEYSHYSGDTIYFKHTVSDNTSKAVDLNDTSLNPYAYAFNIVDPNKKNIRDKAGNSDLDGNIPVPAYTGECVVDDTRTAISPRNFDENGFYPAKYLTEQKFNLFGKLPDELKGVPSDGGSGNANIQPTVFGVDGNAGPVFRIVLNDEVKSSSIGDGTKLKLSVFDSDYKRVDGKYVYADLVAARVEGVSNNTSAFGVKSGAATEMFFRYTPVAGITDEEVYYVAIDTTVLWKGTYYQMECDSDLVTNNGQPIRNIAGSEIIFEPIQVSNTFGRKFIGIDTKAPVFTGASVTSSWVKKLNYGSSLSFDDAGGISDDGGYVSVVYYDDNGNAQKMQISLSGSESGTVINIPVYNWRKEMALGGLALNEEMPDGKQLYLEYSLADEAGNVLTNAGQKNIPVNFDNKGPDVNGSKYNLDGNIAEVIYDVADSGIGLLSDYVYYKVERIGENTDSNIRTARSDTQAIQFTGNQGSRDTWRIWANFSDTLGNRTKIWGNDNLIYTPSEPIDIATRTFALEFVSEGKTVSDKHEVYLNDKKLASSDYTMDLYYKWSKGSANDSKIDYKKITFTDMDEIKDFNFASEEVITQFVPGELSGEYFLYAYAEMSPDNASQYGITKTVYFDRKAPEIELNVMVNGTASECAESYVLNYSMTDDSGSYKNGLYARYRNIEFSKDSPSYTIYLDGKAVRTVVLRSHWGSEKINIYDMYKNNPLYQNASSVKFSVTARDVFGHETTVESEEFPLDFSAPEITSVAVEGNDIYKLEDDFYLIKSFSDISKITCDITDNMPGKLTVQHKKGGLNTLVSTAGLVTERHYEYKNPIVSDFEIRRRDGKTVYTFTFHAIDGMGNTVSKSVDFCWDNGYPRIYDIDLPSRIVTNASERTITYYYTTDEYETLDDITVSADGAGAVISKNDTLGMFSVKVTENGILTVKTADRFGKTSEMVTEVTWFDHELPEVWSTNSTQVPESGAAKYGEIEIHASDNVSDSVFVEVAVVKGSPEDTDFFFNEAGSVLTEAGTDENGYPVFESTGNGYFGDSEYAWASLSEVASEGEESVYILSYRALPDGEYNVYAKAKDATGNEKTELVATISSDSKGAALEELSYTPESITGGEVVVYVETDVPTVVIYNNDAEGNVAVMQDHIAEVRETGYSYVYNGENKSFKTFEEINDLYSGIAAKYASDTSSLTDEEREVYKNGDEGMYSMDPYIGFLNPDRLDSMNRSMDDVLDYLHNEAFYAFENEADRIITADAPRLTQYMSDYEIDWYSDVVEPLENAGIGQYDETGTEITGVGLYNMDILAYPTQFDIYFGSDFEKTETGAVKNPFFGKEYITETEIYSVFGYDVDISLFTAENDVYISPFDAEQEELSEEELASAGLGDYAEHFQPVYNYLNPYAQGESSQYLTESEMQKLLEAIELLKDSREKTAQAVAAKYVNYYLHYTNQEYSEEHYMSYRYNVEKNLQFMDKTDQVLDVPIKIDWIDPSVPHIPAENISILNDYGYPVSGYVNDDYVTLSVTVPEDGIYQQYYLTNIPDGAEAQEVTSELYSDTPLYKSFTLKVYDNTTVIFDVINPSVMDDIRKTYIASQSFRIDCFDREAPEAEVVYSPSKPTGGKKVNTDVTVKLANITDNTSGYNSIYVYDGMYSYTFTENGSVEFVLYDKVGNEKRIPVTVDYIDKTPVEFDIRLSSGGNEISYIEKNTDTTDYTYTVTEFVVDSTKYYSSQIDVEVYVNGNLVNTDMISVGESDWNYEYETVSGNKGVVTVSGFSFDTSAPSASVSYNKFVPGNGQMSYVEAKIQLSDDRLSDLKLTNVSGRYDNGTQITAGDIVYDPQTGEALMKFESNGFADITVTDAAGNELFVQASVSSLDRTAPKAYIQYSSKTPTNSDVQSIIILTEQSDYQITDSTGAVIRAYTGAYTDYINYEFSENSTVFFSFRDADGNETEPLAATVANIDKVKPEIAVKEIHKDKAIDTEGNLVAFNGAATIELQVVSAGDILDGGENDTIYMVNAEQAVYHTVMENGTYTFTYADTAGNYNTLNAEVTQIDRTLPTATITGNPTSWTNVEPVITITADNKADGSPAYVIMNGVEYPSCEFTAKENGSYSYVLRDTSGNATTGFVDVTYVDTTPPVISYEGSKNLYVLPGSFDREAFENVTVSDEEGGSGISSEGLSVDYGNFDADVSGNYEVTFTVSDNAGNKTVLVRNVVILGDEVYALINGEVLIPSQQDTFWQNEGLELSFINAESGGSKVSYAFEKGYFNAAQMKGTKFKNLTTPDAKIRLDAPETGMYTLFVQTEDRKMMTMYVFVAGIEK